MCNSGQATGSVIQAFIEDHTVKPCALTLSLSLSVKYTQITHTNKKQIKGAQPKALIQKL